MAILKVARMGHPVLREVASEVPTEEIATPAFQDFVASMVETMRDYDGVGLAAPQVHVSKRVVVIEVSDSPRYPEEGPVPLSVIINPRIRNLSERRVEVVEGCLSIPDLRGAVPRIAEIEIEALDGQGNPMRERFEGFPAAVVQHECDHLDGVLYLDRVVDTRSLFFVSEIRHKRSEAAASLQAASSRE